MIKKSNIEFNYPPIWTSFCNKVFYDFIFLNHYIWCLDFSCSIYITYITYICTGVTSSQTILKTLPSSLASNLPNSLASNNTIDMKPKPSSIGISYAGTGNLNLYASLSIILSISGQSIYLSSSYPSSNLSLQQYFSTPFSIEISNFFVKLSNYLY